MTGGFLFNDFVLDPANRRLSRDGVAIDLSARYLDALALLASHPGQLITKDRFLHEVWQGVPVTDEALTQCIRTLRRALGDDAARPRFIETVPKHGYRFIAPVTIAEATRLAPAQPAPKPAEAAPSVSSAVSSSASSWRHFFLLGCAGTIGGGVAGMFGGLFYSFVGVPQAAEPGMGAASMLLVLVCLTILIGLLGGAGVAFGIAAAGFARSRSALFSIAGAAAGGFVIGAFVKLVGLDAFNLLFGQSQGEITGGPEGALLGAAVGFGAWLANRGASRSLGRRIAAAGAAGATAGVLIHLLGGRLMAGSLDMLAHRFPNSRIQIDQMGALFGERGFGPVSQAVTGALEGLLFATCVVAAMYLGQRRLQSPPAGN